MIAHFIYTWTGVGNGGQPNVAYSFWSGIGGFSTVIVVILRKVNCHQRGCFRIGKYNLEGTPFVLCRKHHIHVPNRGATAEEIHQAHRDRTRR